MLAGLGGGLLGGLLGSYGVFAPGSGRAGGPVLVPSEGSTARPSGSVASVAAGATPSVVTIEVDGAGGSGTGSGWVYDRAGHVVTNNHVVAPAADGGSINVVLTDGSQSRAKVVGRDVSSDLAVIEVAASGLRPLPVAVSRDVVVGDPVIAVGAPLGLESTVTTGIVSAVDRPVTPGEDDDQSFISAIQTDAAINPGNSGGPLLDMQGQVIGVTSAIARVPGSSIGGQSGNIGVGFAIPSDQVTRIARQLISTGKAEHPVIGVLLDRTYDGEGVKISDKGSEGNPPVGAGSPAAKAGLRAGDVIVALDGRPVRDPDALVVAIRSKGVGDRVTMTLRRGGKDVDVTMVLQGSE